MVKHIWTTSNQIPSQQNKQLFSCGEILKIHFTDDVIERDNEVFTIKPSSSENNTPSKQVNLSITTLSHDWMPLLLFSDKLYLRADSVLFQQRFKQKSLEYATVSLQETVVITALTEQQPLCQLSNLSEKCSSIKSSQSCAIINAIYIEILHANHKSQPAQL